MKTIKKPIFAVSIVIMALSSSKVSAVIDPPRDIGMYEPTVKRAPCIIRSEPVGPIPIDVEKVKKRIKELEKAKTTLSLLREERADLLGEAYLPYDAFTLLIGEILQKQNCKLASLRAVTSLDDRIKLIHELGVPTNENFWIVYLPRLIAISDSFVQAANVLAGLGEINPTIKTILQEYRPRIIRDLLTAFDIKEFEDAQKALLRAKEPLGPLAEEALMKVSAKKTD